jgi:trans-aconitate methyltransferase
MLVAEETINNLIKSKINISVLEVGCGFYARNIQYLKQRFPDVAFVGVDLKCSSIDGIELIEDDIEIWEPSSKFDCVLSLAVVEHLVNLQRHFDLLALSL